MKQLHFSFLIALAAQMISLPIAYSAVLIAGWAEQAVFSQNPTDSDRISVAIFDVKLDTGATTSSFNTGGEIEEYKRGSKNWVRFRVQSSKAKSFAVDAQVVRYAIVKRTGVKEERRPVILLKTCIGGFEKVSEFTLTDRSDMDYPVLIGRNFMQSEVLVDSGRKNITSIQNCMK